MSEPLAIEIRGRFTDRVAGPDATTFTRAWANNLIVDRALDLLAALLAGQAGTRGILYWAVGEGAEGWDALPPDADPKTTRLAREIYRKPLDAARDLHYDPKTRTILLKVTFRPDEAVGMLREFGIFGGDATQAADSGYLINYKIHALIDKTLPRGLERHLEFTLGPLPDIVVPNLVGKTLSAAGAILDLLKLSVGEIARVESADAADMVVAQIPASGARAAVGVGVDLTITTLAQVVVPDLTGLTRARAGEVLVGIGLELDDLPLFEPSDAAPGTIVHQNPQAGARLAKASRVIVVEARVRTTTVPNLAGMSLEGAQIALARARLRLTETPASKENAEMPPELILEQTPAGGETVNVDSIVHVTVSAPPTVSVPNLAGLDPDAAGKALAEAGLTLGGLTQQGSDKPVGLVMEQTPGAGLRVPSGSTVDIVLAMPVALVTPSVVGMTLDQAKAVLEQAGLLLAERTTRRPSNFPTDTIIEQDPAAGAPTGKGAFVRVVLADAVMVLMPKLVGTLLDEARELIKGASLILSEPPQEVDEPDVKVWTVLTQNPVEGTRIAQGSLVSLTVSAPRVNVPNLINLTQSQALPILKEFDLTLDAEITQKATNNADLDGRIAEQSPAANARVAPGTTVKIVLWQVERVRAPNVVGMTHAEAAAALKQAGLAQADQPLTTPTDKTSDVGRVAAQFPKANELVLRGQVVQLTLWVAQLVTVPNLVGMKADAARQTLARLNLQLTRKNQLIDDITQADLVLAQEPAAGTQVQPGTIVNAEVGTVVVFPELRCRQREEAEAFLREYTRKFEVNWDGAISVAFQPSFEEPNIVVGQTPAMGAPIVGALGDVGITVRRAPLPDVRFLPFDRGIEVLKAWSDAHGGVLSDFRTREVQSDLERGTILGQRPDALSADYPERGLVMDFFVAAPRSASRGSPDVMGRDLPVAAKLITGYARTIPTVRLIPRIGDAASERPENIVLEQTPAPGGTPTSGVYTLRISRTLFPDVLCQNVDKAQGIIKEATAGRQVNLVIEKQVSGLDPGTVIAQTPLPLAPIPAVESTMQVTLIVAA